MATDDAIQSKVAELEKQLAMMQELIALKDQQLAALQNQSQSQANPVVQGQAVPSEVVTAKPVNQATSAPQAVTEPVELIQPDQLAETVQPAQPIQPIQPAESLQPVQPVQPKPGSFLNPYYLGGGGAVFLTLLAWLWKRKRKVDRETNTESMFASSIMIETPEADENISAAVGVDTAVHDVGTVGESSFLSEFTPSDFDSFDTDQGEIDPISEADVYLAYGRYQQAEELIRQAIKDQPNRDECKLKLLEIFYANENNAAFEVYANELVAAGKRDEVGFWEKAAEMGRELCPDSPLFTSGGDLFAVDDTDVGNSNESVVRNSGAKKENVNTGVAYFEESDGDDVVKESAGSKGNVLDFDLTSLEAEDDSIVDEQRNNEGIDFDLSSFSMELEEGGQGVIASSRKAGMSAAAQIEDMDFDLSSFSMDTQEPDEEDNSTVSSTFSDMPSATSAINKEQEFESLEFDFSSNDVKTKGIDAQVFSALDNGDKNHQDADFSADRSLTFNDDTSGDFDFDFELDLPSTTREKDPSQHDEFGVSDLTDMDELETKLDLAKAYVDMGDADAAKDIAREVLEQGTAEQKKIAKTLLDELN